MANMIMSKRNRSLRFHQCAYGCCGQKPTKRMKRNLKRSERSRIRREMWMEWN